MQTLQKKLIYIPICGRYYPIKYKARYIQSYLEKFWDSKFYLSLFDKYKCFIIREFYEFVLFNVVQNDVKEDHLFILV